MSDEHFYMVKMFLHLLFISSVISIIVYSYFCFDSEYRKGYFKGYHCKQLANSNNPKNKQPLKIAKPKVNTLDLLGDESIDNISDFAFQPVASSGHTTYYIPTKGLDLVTIKEISPENSNINNDKVTLSSMLLKASKQ